LRKKGRKSISEDKRKRLWAEKRKKDKNKWK
jgi:hypothetical protein